MTFLEIEQEINAVQQELLNAMERQDAAALDRLIADDFLVTGETMGEKLGDKQLYLADLMASGAVEGGSASNDRLKLRVYGNTAIVNSIFQYRVMIEGKEHSGRFLSTTVWIKSGEQWQVVTIHSHRLAETAS